MGNASPIFKRRIAGVLYMEGPGPKPPQIEHRGTTYFRFHDFIYVSKELEELSDQQVVAVCKLRDEHATRKQLFANRAIQGIFLKLVKSFQPNVLLELGPGTRPLFKIGKTPFRYELRELNKDAVEFLRAKGYCASLFKDRTPLDLEARSVDLAVAVFVFQFPVARSQVAEIVRVLSPTGLLVANVYRRSVRARKRLLREFRTRGCKVRTIRRTNGVGHCHEYWLVGRSLNGSKCRSVLEILKYG